MRNHGSIIAAESVEGATARALALEETARIHLEAHMRNGIELTESEALWGRAGLEKTYLTYRWQACVRGLVRSDPDLFMDAGA
jgi:hypothetical protein